MIVARPVVMGLAMGMKALPIAQMTVARVVVMESVTRPNHPSYVLRIAGPIVEIASAMETKVPRVARRIVAPTVVMGPAMEANPATAVQKIAA